jgi:hypothetical protein
MAIPIPRTSQILAEIQAAARRQGTNPYRIATASGMPLTTVQRLLTVAINVPLRNVEMLLTALGMDVHVVATNATSRRAPAGRARRRKR